MARALLRSAPALLLAGCIHRAAATTPRPPPAHEPDGAYWDAPGPPPPATEIRLEGRQDGHDLYRIHLPPRLPPELEEVPHAADPIEILHYRPADRGQGPRPLVILSPILGNGTLLVCGFAQAFARQGWHAAIVFRKELAFDARSTLGRAEQEMRLVVMRSRQVVDWLLATENVDPQRIAAFGISAGAIVSTTLAGADPRIRASVIVLGGGPLADVLIYTSEDRFQKYAREIMRTTGLDRERIRSELRRTFRSDPIALAPRISREGVLMILAGRDRSVPTRHGLALWRALGRPELDVTPFGHYASFVLLPWMHARAVTFLRARFRAEGG